MVLYLPKHVHNKFRLSVSVHIRNYSQANYIPVKLEDLCDTHGEFIRIQVNSGRTVNVGRRLKKIIVTESQLITSNNRQIDINTRVLRLID